MITTRLTADELRELPAGTEYWPQSHMGYIKTVRGVWVEVASGASTWTSNEVASIHPAKAA